MIDKIITAFVVLIIRDLVFYFHHKHLGTIKVNERDYRDIKIRIVFDRDVEFSKCRYAIFKIENDADFSHK